jgi:oligopeptidase B
MKLNIPVHYIVLSFSLFSLIQCKPDTPATAINSPLLNMAAQNLSAPTATKKPKELTLHGDIRQDPYYWLNERENPEVIDYLTAENHYTDTMMSHAKGFEDKLYNELVGRVKQTDMSVLSKTMGISISHAMKKDRNILFTAARKETLKLPRKSCSMSMNLQNPMIITLLPVAP